MSKKSSLGTGLTELLSNIKQANQDPQNEKALLKSLSIERLKPGKYQPRGNIDQQTLQELAKSIQAQGIIQPLIVRPIDQDSYEIVAGERRWRAAQLAKLTQVPAIIYEIPDNQTIALSLIENIQREELNVIDTALSIQRLINEFDMTHENAASAIGKSRTAVTNLLRLLQLPKKIQELLQQGSLEMGHGRAILPLKPPQQLLAAKIISDKKLSVRASEKLVKQLQQSPKPTRQPFVDPSTKELQNRLSEKLAASVKIQHTGSGKGKIIIGYNSLDELEGILVHIK